MTKSFRLSTLTKQYKTKIKLILTEIISRLARRHHLYSRSNSRSRGTQWNWWLTFPRKSTSARQAQQWTGPHFEGSCRCAGTRAIPCRAWGRWCLDWLPGWPDLILLPGFARFASGCRCKGWRSGSLSIWKLKPEIIIIGIQ